MRVEEWRYLHAAALHETGRKEQEWTLFNTKYTVPSFALCIMGFCAACPLNSDGKSMGCVLCNYDTIKVIERTQKLIDWAEKWPRTRQDAFKRYFSDAPMKNGIINICPKKIDKSYKTKCVRDGKPCEQCKKDYWLEGISNGK